MKMTKSKFNRQKIREDLRKATEESIRRTKLPDPHPLIDLPDPSDEIERMFDCDPLRYQCEECSRLLECLQSDLKWFNRLPRFIIDNYLRKLSGAELKIFLYLNDKANWSKKAKDYGACFMSFEEISWTTGLSINHIGKYVKSLQKHGLIYHVQNKKFVDGRWVTFHRYEVTFYKRLEELKNSIKN